MSTEKSSPVGDAEGVREKAQALVESVRPNWKSSRNERRCQSCGMAVSEHGADKDRSDDIKHTTDCAWIALRTALATPIPSEVTHDTRVRSWLTNDEPGQLRFAAYCSPCKWDGTPRASYDEAMSDARAHDSESIAEVTTGEPETGAKGPAWLVAHWREIADRCPVPAAKDTLLGCATALENRLRTSPPGGDGEGGFAQTMTQERAAELRAKQPREQLAKLLAKKITPFFCRHDVLEYWSSRVEEVILKTLTDPEQPPLASRSTVDEEPVAWIEWRADVHFLREEAEACRRSQRGDHRAALLDETANKVESLYRKPQQ